MADIRLYNTKTRQTEDFAPQDASDVKMYVCGPTVYDRAHLGNARPVVVFDVLYRLLRQQFGADHVTYVRNFTDVDDRINETAQKHKAAGAAGTLEQLIHERSDETIGWYHDDMDALGALRPNAEPRATEFIQPMVDMIADLIAKDHAYEAEGHVLFAVDSYKAYGALSGRSVDDMIAGARVEVAPYKRNPMDFVLWKPSTDDLPGWDSPWGRGRPGWHIECSAMAKELLGTSFDIHGGGIDLQFPHHENEIAQSSCADPGCGFAKVWLHNEMLQVEGKKMSKSLGNFFTVRDLLDQGIPGEVIRFVLLSTHYRKPMDWTEKKVTEARRTLARWGRAKEAALDASLQLEADGRAQSDAVLGSLQNDLNTYNALRGIDVLARRVLEDDVASESWKQDGIIFLNSLKLLGYEDLATPNDQAAVDRIAQSLEFEPLIQQLVEARKTARAEKDWGAADKIRDVFVQAGVKISDDPDGGVTYTLEPNFDPSKLALPS